MVIRRRRFLRAAGAGAALGIAGCAEADRRAERGTPDAARTDDDELLLATTTSTDDSGLVAALVPAFEERFDVRVKTVVRGSGAVLRLARRGDADVVLVHAREAEDAFLREGFGLNRRDVMFNDFVVVGPDDDPADVSGDGLDAALRGIADAEAVFLSRGDDSGTNKKERAVWAAAGVEPGGTWYRETGRGQGDTLVQASQVGGYALTDRGTFRSMREDVDLVVHVQGPLTGGPTVLKNSYGVIPVNPAVHDAVNYELAMAWVGYLTGPAGQERIATHEVGGDPLFRPSALDRTPNFEQYAPSDA